MKKKPKLLIVGFAVKNPASIHELNNYLEIEFISLVNLKYLLKNENVFAIWIHFDTFLDQSFFEYLANVKFLISTTTGLTHISPEIQDFFAGRLISLSKQYELLNKITSTAELAWSLIMYENNILFKSINSVKLGYWRRQDFLRPKQMSSKKIGIIGFGRVGSMISNYAKAFGMKVHVYDVSEYALEKARVQNFSRAPSISFLFESCDIISLSASVEKNSRPIVGKNELDKIRDDLILVNTARAGLVDEEAIINNILHKPFLRYLTDVTSHEELGTEITESRLWQESQKNSRITITPHIGGASEDAIFQVEIFLASKILKLIQEIN